MRKTGDNQSKELLNHKFSRQSLFLLLIFLSLISIFIFLNYPNNIWQKSPDTYIKSTGFSLKTTDDFLLEEFIINCSETTGKIYVTDANGDGYKDIFVGEWYNNFFTVLYWNPDIRYWDPPIKKNTTSYTGRIIVEDVNNDGKKDIITTSYIGTFQIILWDNLASDWNYTIIKDPCDYPSRFCVGDANNDTINEIIVLDQVNEGFIYIYRWNQSIGDFIKITKEVGQLDGQVKIADVNNDGTDEIITCSMNPSGLIILYWNNSLGDWTIDTKTYSYSTNIDPEYLSIGDVNNDGFNDVIFTGGYLEGYLGILLWNPTLGNWDDEIIIPFNKKPYYVEIGDLNNDGQNDIIMDFIPGYSILCWNSSLDCWNPPINGSITGGPTWRFGGGVVIEDINKDGLNDFLLRNIKKQGFSLFLGYYSIETPILEPITPNINYNNSLMLRWDGIENATLYYIYRDTKEIVTIDESTPIAIVSETNYTDSVPINGKYKYAIVAGDRFAQSLISNNEDVIVAVNLTSKLLFSGKNFVDIDSNCYNSDINVSLSLSLTNNTTLLYSCYNHFPFNISLENSLLFFEAIINNTHNIEGEVNFTIYFNQAKYKNLEFWILNFSLKNGTGEWEKLAATEEKTGIILISVDHLSYFAISEIVIVENELVFIYGYDLFSLICIVCFLSTILLKKYKNAGAY